MAQIQNRMAGPENNRRHFGAIRSFLAMLLVLVAIACSAPGIFLPFDLASQARTDRFYYEQFRHAAAYVERTGQLPEGSPLDNLEGRSIYPVLMDGSDCGPAFKKRASDRFVLSFWRGEWTECYAFPSGETTLSMSLIAYLRKSSGQLLIAFWIVVLVASWGAARLTRVSRPASAVASDGNGGPRS